MGKGYFALELETPPVTVDIYNILLVENAETFPLHSMVELRGPKGPKRFEWMKN